MRKERKQSSRLLDVGVVEAACNAVAVDCQHTELTPNDFTVGVRFQLSLNFVPHFFLRIELGNFSCCVVEAFDVDSIANGGTGWNFQWFAFGLAESAKNVSLTFDAFEL